MHRILFVVNADWFFVSHRLALAKAVQAAGYEVAVCAGSSEAHERIVAEGLPFYPLPIDRGGTHPLKDLVTLQALASTYRRYRPALVHHVTIKPVLYGSLAARACGVPAVVNAVSGLGYAFIPRASPSVAHSAMTAALRRGYRLALSGSRTRVIFQNDDDRRTFVEGGMVDASRARIIRGSGVDLRRFEPAPLRHGPFTAVLPARLLWDKGVGEFVQAARRLKGRYPSARFVLVGRLDYDNPAAISEAQVRAWVAEGIIEWRAECQPADMPEVYADAHVVVLPSYREGLPLALAEAAAAGRAVITTDAPGCRDTVEDGETGWLVPLRDASGVAGKLEQCLNLEPAALTAIGLKARKLAEARFDIGEVIAQTLATYRELLPEQG